MHPLHPPLGLGRCRPQACRPPCCPPPTPTPPPPPLMCSLVCCMFVTTLDPLHALWRSIVHLSLLKVAYELCSCYVLLQVSPKVHGVLDVLKRIVIVGGWVFVVWVVGV